MSEMTNRGWSVTLFIGMVFGLIIGLSARFQQQRMMRAKVEALMVECRAQIKLSNDLMDRVERISGVSRGGR